MPNFCRNIAFPSRSIVINSDLFTSMMMVMIAFVVFHLSDKINFLFNFSIANALCFLFQTVLHYSFHIVK